MTSATSEVAATFTIHKSAASMPKAERTNMAKWLRHLADQVEKEYKEYDKRFTAKFYW